jgi:hypothetical protein
LVIQNQNNNKWMLIAVADLVVNATQVLTNQMMLYQALYKQATVCMNTLCPQAKKA